MPFARCSMASHVTFATNGSNAPAIQFEGSRPQVLLLCVVPASASPAGARGNRAGPTQPAWPAMGRIRPAGTDHRGFPHQDRRLLMMMMMMMMMGYINLSPHDDDYHVTLMIIMISIIMMMNML
ncbi:hypothetical protein DPMN_053935 [Dreissena polymorpha]|uniref:Uncharacterized protein n=1 Tax=Dreissena polymorpha TaxID=45954 RepID=A0A9D4HQS1_DREPO|nr:hypothetical protein DPMN_053935 [Dreissena polymorpha]